MAQMKPDSLADLAMYILLDTVAYESEAARLCGYLKKDVKNHFAFVLEILEDYKENKNKALLRWTYTTSITENIMKLALILNCRKYGLEIEKYQNYKYGDPI